MGKRKQRTQARDFKEPRQNVWKEPRTEGGAPAERSRGTNFDEIVKANDTFDAYYKVSKLSRVIGSRDSGSRGTAVGCRA